ncbi:MAG: carbon-nitrogen hydrolase family protein [Acidimicrobiia bacterium]|nr:carbon-nitrogen hydrolase family protein [Acidimicrobiia bacterium]
MRALGEPTPTLAVAVAQPLTVLGDLDANVHEHVAAIEDAGARLVVFPEMSLTGYDMAAPIVHPEDPRLAPLVAACDRTDAVALVGAPVGTPAADFIGVLVVWRGGVAEVYRKMYLGSAESVRFTAGQKPAVVEVDGWRIGLAVCKDTGVPAHAAATAESGMDVYAAGVLEHADDAHVQPERARRVTREHGVWAAIASFAGSTGGGFTEACGGSAIFDPEGAAVATAGVSPGETIRHLLTKP